MGPIWADRQVVGDPEAPRVNTSVAGHSGAGTTAYLVGTDGGAGQESQRALVRGAGVGTERSALVIRRWV